MSSQQPAVGLEHRAMCEYVQKIIGRVIRNKSSMVCGWMNDNHPLESFAYNYIVSV